MNTQAIKTGFKTVGHVLQKHAPVILGGTGIVGMITTAVFAERAGRRAAKLEQGEDWDLKEKAKNEWKIYLPTIGMGALTTGCIIGSMSVSARRLAAISGLYTITETKLHDYQSKVAEMFGETKEKSVRDDIHKDIIEANDLPSKDIVTATAGDTWCFDVFSGRYFKSNVNRLRRIEADVNKMMVSEMFTSLNFVYQAIDAPGLTEIPVGDQVGWNSDTMMHFEFSSQLTPEGEPCLVVDYEVQPRFEYDRLF